MKRPAVVGIAVGAAVLLAAGAGAVGVFGAQQPPADQAARTYLRALAEGDLATINHMRQPTAEDAEHILTTAFEEAESYIADPRIESIEPDGGGASSVTATVELDGEQRELGFVMNMVEGRWSVTAEHLGTVRVSAHSGGLPLGDSVMIGDTLAPSKMALSLLPAVYRVSAAPLGLLTGETTVSLTNENTDVTMTVSLSPHATPQAQNRLDEYADSCASATTQVPEACGLRVPWAADLAQLERIDFRIEEYPVVKISDDGRTFAATDGVIIATGTGMTRSGESSRFTYRTDGWALRGAVTFRGAQMLLSVD